MASHEVLQEFIWPYADPPLYESFSFETFDVVACRNWMEKNWSVSVYICAIYLFLVATGHQFMKGRKAYDLKSILAVWNLSFALFSVVGFFRCLPELLYVLTGDNGIHRSICVRDNHTQVSAFWAWAFTLSKVIELGDTAFIILRKKQLMFIHYYHHSVALIICWCYYSDYEPIARWFGIINFAVHTILYFYLFLKTINIYVPRVFATWVIFLELLQMIVGLVVNFYALSMNWQGVPCARNFKAIRVQMLLYASFLFIFLYLFKNSGNRSKAKDKTN